MSDAQYALRGKTQRKHHLQVIMVYTQFWFLIHPVALHIWSQLANSASFITNFWPVEMLLLKLHEVKFKWISKA